MRNRLSALGRRAVAGLIVVAGLAVVGVAGASESLPALSTQFNVTELPRHGHARATATCGPNHEILSGGFSAPDAVYAGGGPYQRVQAAYRASDRRFVVKAENQAFRTGHVYAFAYCGHVGKVTVARSEGVELGSFDVGTTTAHCPVGLTAISGGWAGIARDRGRPAMVPFRSKRAGTHAWKVSAQNIIFKGSEDLYAYAYCAETDAPAAVVERARMAGFNEGSADSSCPAGSQAIAGGFDAASRNGYNLGTDVVGSRRKGAGTRWHVNYMNGRDARKIKVFAYCVALGA
jgi:hypothetical protein